MEVLHGCRQLVPWGVGLSAITSATPAASCHQGVLGMNPTQTKKWKELFKNLRLYIIVIITMAIFGIAYLAILQDTLLRNSQELGTALAKSYVAEETSNLTVFETLITFGTNSINAQQKLEKTDEDIESWIGTFYQQMQAVLGASTIDPYAILNGKLIAANPR